MYSNGNHCSRPDPNMDETLILLHVQLISLIRVAHRDAPAFLAQYETLQRFGQVQDTGPSSVTAY